MLKKVLLAGAASLFAVSAAQAADIVAPEVYDWTGPYVGLQGGYAWGENDATADGTESTEVLALDSDDHLFNAQQTVPLDMQLELTNGAFRTVRREGTHNLSDWDWELVVKAWGCAEYGLL